MKEKINTLFTYLHLDNKQWIGLFILTMIMNLLYCSLHSIVNMLANSITQPILYYIVQYVLYIILSIIYYLLFTQFIRHRKQDKEKIQWRSFLFPLIKFESLWFVLMELIAYFSFSSSLQLSPLRYIFIVLSILLVIVYIPLRLYGYHQIYHQQKNPFMIVKNSFHVLYQNYLPIFYSWFAMACLFGITYYIGIYLFQIPISFYFISMTSNVLTLLNPFMLFYTFMQSTQTFDILIFGFTLIMGVILSLAMVYYFSYIINVFDEQS